MGVFFLYKIEKFPNLPNFSVNFPCFFYISHKNNIKMVVIHDNLTDNHYFIPKNFAPKTSGLTLTIKSTVNNEETVFNVSDLSGLTDFFVVNPDMSEVPDGEYKYTVKDGEGETNSTGLIKKGNWKPSKTEYNDTIEYTEYQND